MCTVLLPPRVNPTVVNKCIISNNINIHLWMVRHKRMTNYRLNILQQKDECNRYHVQKSRMSAIYSDTSVYIRNKRDVADIV